MAELFSVDPGPRVHNLKAMGPVLGLDVFQTHNLAKRLNLPGWGVGQGQERRLSTLEVFLLKVAGLARGVLPTEALRNATSAAAVYFCSVENDPELRAKPAALTGYQIGGGAWIFLLEHSGPPAVAGPMLLTLKMHEVLAEVLRGCGEDWSARASCEEIKARRLAMEERRLRERKAALDARKAREAAAARKAREARRAAPGLYHYRRGRQKGQGREGQGETGA